MDKLQRKLEEPGTLREIAVEPTAAQDLSPAEAQPHHTEGDVAVSDDGAHVAAVGREGGRADSIIDADTGKALPRENDVPR